MQWPDIVILIVVVLGTLSGLRRGFIGELTGAIAISAAIFAAFTYSGSLDHWVADRTNLGPGSSHVIGMVVFGLMAYAIVLALGLALGVIAKLPIIGIANNIGGAVVGFVKSVLLVWVALYVALFFPLSRDLRQDLHKSVFVGYIETPNHRLDENLKSSLPWYVRPFSGSMFDRHHV